MQKSYTQSSIEDRALIQTQLICGIKPSEIALSLGRSASTISRELRRNGWMKAKKKRCQGQPILAVGAWSLRRWF